MKSYIEVIEYYKNLPKKELRVDTDIAKLMRLIGNPQKEFMVVRVGGGRIRRILKAYLESILLESGLNVGVFSANFSTSIRDQITVLGEAISEDEFIKLSTLIDRLAVESGIEQRTEHAIKLAVSLKYFEQKKVDIAILENPSFVDIHSKKINWNEILAVEIKSENQCRDLKAGGSVFCSLYGMDVSAETGEEFKVRRDLNTAENYAKDIKVSPESASFVYGDKRVRGVAADNSGEAAIAALAATEWLTDRHSINFKIQDVISGIGKAKAPSCLEPVNNNPIILADLATTETHIEDSIMSLREIYPNNNIIAIYNEPYYNKFLDMGKIGAVLEQKYDGIVIYEPLFSPARSSKDTVPRSGINSENHPILYSANSLRDLGRFMGFKGGMLDPALPDSPVFVGLGDAQFLVEFKNFFGK